MSLSEHQGYARMPTDPPYRPTVPSRSRSRATRFMNLRAHWRNNADFVLLCALLVFVAAGGGSAFADTISLLYVRLTAVLALVVFSLTPARPDWRSYRAPMLMLAVLAIIMIVQLVPLPPEVWTALPGREPYLEAAHALGAEQPWRPLSLTPDLTANSLVALVIPAAVLIGFSKITPEQQDRLLLGFIILCFVSIVLGVAQISSGSQSALYWYKRTYPGTAVGLLANRNHHGAMLAMLFPALYAWIQSPARDTHWTRWRLAIAGTLSIIAIPVVLATGSRAGVLLSLFAIAVAMIAFSGRPSRSSVIARHTTWIRIAVATILIAMAIMTWQFGRALSIQRLVGGAPGIEEDLRFRYVPYVWNIVVKTFPAGTGFGSFDPVFRQYEPDVILKNTYFNHAHNELLELTMTAGLAGALLLGGFLLWWAVRIVATVRNKCYSPQRQNALLGATMIAVLLLASLVDYPLRTPLLEAWFAIACGWLCVPPNNHPE